MSSAPLKFPSSVRFGGDVAMTNPGRTGFSGHWHRTGLLVIGACALIAWIYRRSIREFFYPVTNPPSKNITELQGSPTKKPIPRNFTAIEIPNNVAMTTYQGSNAEYIVFKNDGSSVTKQEYLDLAVPILKLLFPRNKEVEEKLSPDILDQLDQNEVDYINKALGEKGLKAIKIPKTLYDIFYIAFRLSTSFLCLLRGKNGCEVATFLERFLRPSAQIYLH